MLQTQKKITLVNRTQRQNRKVEWIVIHYVGAESSAKANVNYFYNQNRGASAHYFIDENEIWQCVEEKDSAWHCGANTYYNSCRNSNSIGIEMCCKKNPSGNWYIEERTVQNTIELVRELMKKYSIDINYVVRHYDVTRKICPEPFVRDEKQWLDFKKRLAKTEGDIMLDELIKEYGEPQVKKALERLIKTENDDGLPAPWAEKELEEAKEKLITDGTNPEALATRQEVALMVLRAIKNK